MIGLADCNNFFVSCERTVNPSLCGRPVVVLSNNDGCAVARSNEAKQLGVRMGQPAFELRHLIESGKLIALSGNHLLYREKSIRIHDILRRFVPSTLDYSVDESFLDFSGIPREVIPDIALSIHKTCLQEEGIPVTVGVSFTKTLAKIANTTAKKALQPVAILDSDEAIRERLASLSIGDLWGVGRNIAKKLIANGVFTAVDFADRPLIWVRKLLGINGERSWRELHGESCIELSHLSRPMQDSISETRTFPIDIDDFDYIRARIAIYCAHVAKRLRAMGGRCGVITVFLRTNRFHTERGYSAPQTCVKFSEPVDDTAVLTSAAVEALGHIFEPGTLYKRAGVILSDISSARTTPSLFESEEASRARIHSKALMQTLDRLNIGAGPHVVKLASQLTKGHIGHNDGYSSSFGAPNPNG